MICSMCFNPYIDDRILFMKKKLESNIILENDEGETLRIAKNEEGNFTIGTDEEAYFTFEPTEAQDILNALNLVVFGEQPDETE